MLINQRKKDLRLVVITAIITTLIVSGIGVVAAKLTAKDIGFTSKHEGWEVTNVEDAMNDLFKIGKYEITPDTYFYDSSTSGEEIVRYKKVEGRYYLCDQNGNVTSEEEQDITGITLLEYTAATSANLSVGKAGFANTNFVLGDGTDNINYKNPNASVVTYTSTTITKATTFSLKGIEGYNNLALWKNLFVRVVGIYTNSNAYYNEVTCSYNPSTGVLSVGMPTQLSQLGIAIYYLPQ